MKRFSFIILLGVYLVSCVPTGKMTKVVDQNKVLISENDSLNNKLNDTISTLQTSVKKLKDSVVYYRELAIMPPDLNDADVLLYQMSSGSSLVNKKDTGNLKIVNNINSWLADFKTDIKKYSDAEIYLKKGVVFVDISDYILFNSGSYSLNKESQAVLKSIANLLQAQPELNFMIEGHTDNRIIKGKKIVDNWSLSVNRATAVARMLVANYKIDPKRIIAAGRSQYDPVDNNDTKGGRLKNRRIRIVFLPTFDKMIGLDKNLIKK
jgi:chemotaxis protein MotB